MGGILSLVTLVVRCCVWIVVCGFCGLFRRLSLLSLRCLVCVWFSGCLLIVGCLFEVVGFCWFGDSVDGFIWLVLIALLL